MQQQDITRRNMLLTGAGAMAAGWATLAMPEFVFPGQIDVNGRVQPSADDDEIALKRTYWEAYEQWPRKIELEA